MATKMVGVMKTLYKQELNIIIFEFKSRKESFGYQEIIAFDHGAIQASCHLEWLTR